MTNTLLEKKRTTAWIKLVSALPKAVALLVSASLAATACGGIGGDSSVPLETDLGVLFPKRGESTPPHEVARASGELTVDDTGCLRVAESEGGPIEPKESEGDTLVPVWPLDYELATRDDAIVVLNGAGEEAARVGQEVEMNGANHRPGLRRVPEIERVLRELRGTCPEPYFIVDIASKDIERDPELRRRIEENIAKAQYRGG